MVSPIAVPPGSRVSRNGLPNDFSRAANRCTCVDFPQPSLPSKVMNGDGDMMIELLDSLATKSNEEYDLYYVL